MAFKFGKKNEVSVFPLAYNIMLDGESGIGKTTISKQFCEKLVGDNYIFLEMGKEDGASAINGINYITCPDWDSEYDETTNSMGFHTFVEDVVENKSTDWADLQAVVVDGSGELFRDVAEPEVIRMHNKENPTKRVKTIRAAFGGFQGGEDKAVEIVLNDLWALKSVGVSFIIIGHTKNRTKYDPITGEEYTQLTSALPNKYFEALKTKVHFYGIASIDREIAREKGKKNSFTGEVATKGVVKNETRKITFRDDNYNADAKSRFADIVESIPFDVDELVKALEDAIKAEQSKSGVSFDDAKKEQLKQKKEQAKRVAENEKKAKAQAELDSVIEEIVQFFTENKSDMDKIKPIMQTCKDNGFANPKEINDLEIAKEILAMTLV